MGEGEPGEQEKIRGHEVINDDPSILYPSVLIGWTLITTPDGIIRVADLDNINYQTGWLKVMPKSAPITSRKVTHEDLFGKK